MPKQSSAVSIGLIREVFSSEFTPQLFTGSQTHEPALRLVAQLVRHTEDDNLLQAIVTAALPENYSGDTLRRTPRNDRGRAKEKASTRNPPVRAGGCRLSICSTRFSRSKTSSFFTATC